MVQTAPTMARVAMKVGSATATSNARDEPVERFGQRVRLFTQPVDVVGFVRTLARRFLLPDKRRCRLYHAE
jgi:hypothetical protein